MVCASGFRTPEDVDEDVAKAMRINVTGALSFVRLALRIHKIASCFIAAMIWRWSLLFSGTPA